MDFLRSIISEPGTREGSSQRVAFLLLICFILAWVTRLVLLNNKLPDVPESFASLMQWLGGFIVTGIGVGKLLKTIEAVKGKDNEIPPAE